MIKLSNEHFNAEIDPFGAQLISLTKNNQEYIWQRDSQYWSSSAPLLFPILGSFKNDEYLVDNKSYFLTQHGFIRHSNLVVTNQNDTQVTLQLNYNETTLQQYPYKFNFEVTYTLLNQGITTSISVTNIDDKPIYFSVGGHPGFNIPINKNEVLEDYYIEFEKTENLKTTSLTQKTAILTNNQQRFFLNESFFNNNALFFSKPLSQKISIKSINHKTTLGVNAHKPVTFYGIWKPVNAPLICLEPWDGHVGFDGLDCDFKNRYQIHELAINQSYTFAYDILIED